MSPSSGPHERSRRWRGSSCLSKAWQVATPVVFHDATPVVNCSTRDWPVAPFWATMAAMATMASGDTKARQLSIQLTFAHQTHCIWGQDQTSVVNLGQQLFWLLLNVPGILLRFVSTLKYREWLQCPTHSSSCTRENDFLHGGRQYTFSFTDVSMLHYGGDILTQVSSSLQFCCKVQSLEDRMGNTRTSCANIEKVHQDSSRLRCWWTRMNGLNSNFMQLERKHTTLKQMQCFSSTVPS